LSAQPHGTVFLRPEARARHLEPLLLVEHLCGAGETSDASASRLDDVSLAVARGELVALVGARGSGASSIVRIIAGLDRPSSGSIVLDGRELTGRSDGSAARLRTTLVGYLGGDPLLLDELSALENVMLPMLLAGTARRTARERAGALLEAVGVASAASSRPPGMQAEGRTRVALARALANAPQVLVADEPTASLSTAASERVVELLHRLNADELTLIFSTSSPELSLEAPRRIHLAGGRIVREEESPRL
jgi:predicted ABC-type transport system involved in lysophospholipase L1 biosynthesis ATPase subunit